ncbi:MAG TPA: AAA family ATPase [Chromatiales bacterium]|nr:AAA family ATPase [Chromatiales bacterium]
MYEEFYGLKEKPFSLTPDPEFLFLSTKHKHALTLLEYGLENQAGFTVITGHIGSGKTTLARKLLQEMQQDVTVGLVSNSQCESFEELMQWILFAFGLDFGNKSKVELYQVFSDFLISEYAKKKRTVLIIDEAQHLGEAMLEELRMLSNINADKHQVLQLILIGQPELWELLHNPRLEQFVQRIAVDYHLEPLDQDEVREYIQHRLMVAGGAPDIFDEEVYEVIWRHTNGVPRLINLICDTALVYGFGDQKKHIDEELVRDVIRDKRRSVAPLKNKNVVLHGHKKFMNQDNEGDGAKKKKRRRSTIEKWNDL